MVATGIYFLFFALSMTGLFSISTWAFQTVNTLFLGMPESGLGLYTFSSSDVNENFWLSRGYEYNTEADNFNVAMRNSFRELSPTIN